MNVFSGGKSTSLSPVRSLLKNLLMEMLIPYFSLCDMTLIMIIVR
jgi:hypothetical protein